MSFIPEIIIQRVLVNGIREVRANPWKIDQILRNVPQDFSQQFYDLLKDTSVDITINYPREDSQFPCIAILLRGEEEAKTFLGDFLGGGHDDTDGLINSEELFFTPNASSAGASLEVGDVFGEPRKLFNSEENVYKERIGSAFNSSYTLQIMTDNQDFTIFLYHLVRFILIANIKVFENNGMHQINFSGTDFLPQPMQQPNFIFMRGLSMNFLYFTDHFSVIDEGIAKAFVLDIHAESADGSILSKAQSPHATSISPTSASAGESLTGIIISGINLEIGGSVSVFDPKIANSEDYFSISNVELISSTIEIVFQSSFAGQANSTNLEYRANTGDSVPSDLLEGMFLSVTGPATHGAYGEHRRIISFACTSNGAIRVATEFSASLAGAYVEVFKRGSQVSFDMVISDKTVSGARDVKVTNPDLMYDTLTNGFNIT